MFYLHLLLNLQATTRRQESGYTIAVMRVLLSREDDTANRG